MNQQDQILGYLKKHKKITSITAIGMFGITRLSAVVFKLRADGYPITSKRKPAEKSGTYVEYCYVAPEQPAPTFGVENDSRS